MRPKSLLEAVMQTESLLQPSLNSAQYLFLLLQHQPTGAPV